MTDPNMISEDPRKWLKYAKHTLPPTIITRAHAKQLVRDHPDALLEAKADRLRCSVDAAEILLEFFQSRAPGVPCLLCTESFMKHPVLSPLMAKYPLLFADPVSRNRNSPVSRLAKRIAFHRLTGIRADFESLRADLAQAKARYPKLHLSFFDEKINNLS